MAAIDKTYVTSYKDYKNFIEWAKGTHFPCPNGFIMKPIEYVYDWFTETDFDGEKEIPIMNTDNDVDYFLIKYCPFQFVQDRMKQVYGEEYYQSVLNGTSPYDTFVYPERGTKVKEIKIGRSFFTKSRKAWKFYSPLREKITKPTYFIGATYNDMNLWYDEKQNKFLLPYEFGDGRSSYANKCRSIKAVIRLIRKWKLPVGTIIDVSGRYVGEEYRFIVKK